MLRAQGFSKKYSSSDALACDDITLSVESGKITVLLGPNGAGKSTLLKAFAGLHYATSGNIFIEQDGALFDAAEFPKEAKSAVGFVSEVPALYDDWTTLEFLRMAARLRLSPDCVETAVQKTVKLCSLKEALNKKISSLSHGYKQRVNFAQALVHDPQILILDEPATGLDPLQIREMRELVQSLKKSRAIVFSTHIIQEAQALADTVCIISGGRIAASGSVPELLKQSGKTTLEDAYLFFVQSTCDGKTKGGEAAPDSSAASASRALTAFGPASFCRLFCKELFACAINPFYWICGAVFSAFCAAAFFWGTRFFVQGQGSAALSPFFLLMPYILSVLIPAFCMNIKSRAFDATLPFGEFQKAAARVLAGLAVFALYLLFTIFVPICVSLFGSVDAGAVFVSYLGLLFFAAASISFCVFLSTIFESRAAYFAASVLALAAVNTVHNVLALVPIPESLSAAVRSISFAWRFDSASKGILDTRDFCFFVICALLFVFDTCFAAERRKGKKYFCKKRSLRSWTIVLILIFLALDSSRIYKRLDFSAGKNYSPSERTKELLASAEEKIRISYYRSSELLKLYPQVRDVGDFLRSLSLSCKNVFYSEYDADKASAQKVLAGLDVPPFQIQKQKNNSMEFVDSYSAVVIDYGGKTLCIPASFSTFGLEYDINLRLDYLLNGKSRAAYVLCANGMSLQKDFKSALDWLNLEGFETRALSADDLSAEAALDPQIPLVLFGTDGLDARAAENLQNFLDSGGALFAATSPYKANVDGDWSLAKNKLDYVLPLLERRGISFLDSIAADISCVRANFRSAENGGQDRNASVNYPLWPILFPQEAAPFGATVFWASPLSVDNDKAVAVLETSQASWRFLPDKKNPDLLFDTNPFTVPKSAIEDPLIQKERSVVAARTLDNKVFVISGDLFANDLLLSLSGGETGDFRNLNILTSSLLELSGEKAMAALKNKGAADHSLWKIADGGAFNSVKNFSLLANFVFVPLAILILAAIFFARRKEGF